MDRGGERGGLEGRERAGGGRGSAGTVGGLGESTYHRAAGEIHRDGSVAAFGPELDPLREGGAAAAVDKNDRGK